MREPSFWWEKRGIAATLLAPLAAGYAAVAAARMRKPGGRAGIPVICIGNLTLGGAGKTPAALAAGKILIAAGERPFFLSRGYGGRLSGPLRVDPRAHRAAEVGDEALLLARVAPAVVSRDRFAGAAFAQAEGASVIVMDDGLQNASLAKDLTIAVVDGRRGIGNGCVFPAGPLRAPLSVQLAHVQAMLFVGEVAAAAPLAEICAARKLPLFHGSLVPDANAVAALGGGPVLAFAGIGNPGKFFSTLAAAGIDVRMTREFPDHHRITAAEAGELAGQARTSRLRGVTTEKDWVRMEGDEHTAALRAMTQVLPVTLSVGEAEAFRALLLRPVGKT